MWHRLIVWLDTSMVPVWTVIVICVVYFGVRLSMQWEAYNRDSTPEDNGT
jgi:hypothetical protein